MDLEELFASFAPVPGAIVSDCVSRRDGRLPGRFQALNRTTPALVHVDGRARDLELSGGLLEQIISYTDESLPAALQPEAVIWGNAAARTPATRATNGPQFGFFWVGKVLVVTTVGGRALTMLRAFGLGDEVRLLDIREVLGHGNDKLGFALDVDTIAKDPFRSFKAQPLMAWMVLHERELGIEVPTLPFTDPVPEAGSHVLVEDEHGNLKLTVSFPVDKGYAGEGRLIQLIGGKHKEPIPIRYYPELQDIPPGRLGLFRDSVQLGGRALLGLAVGGLEGKSAAQVTKLKSGAKVRLRIGGKA